MRSAVKSRPPSLPSVTSSHSETLLTGLGSVTKEVGLNAKCNVLCTVMHPGVLWWVSVNRCILGNIG